MIVNQNLKGWKIVSHYTHGLLAGKIAAQLKDSLKHTLWIDTLTAIIEHDDHLLDFEEQNYLTPTGAPLDFTLSTGTDAEVLEHGQRVYNDAAQKSQLIALLVGRHLSFLNEALAASYKPMKKFLKHVEDLRETQRKSYGISKKDEDALYNILLFCDRCSLILCQEKLPEAGRKLEINQTIEDKTYFISTSEEGIVTVDPWCFKEDTFTVEFEYRLLDKLKFEDNKELEKALAEASVQLEQVCFSK